MRILAKSDRNRMDMEDKQGGGVITLYYSTPTTKQVVAYRSQTIRMKGGKTIFDHNAVLRIGLEILSGIGEGSFGDADGRPISSDPASPNYRSDWKELIAELSADVPMLLAQSVFDGLRAGAEPEEVVGGEVEETSVPLESK